MIIAALLIVQGLVGSRQAFIAGLSKTQILLFQSTQLSSSPTPF